MQNKREQAKEWCIVLQKQDYKQNIELDKPYVLEHLNALSIPYYAFILHDRFSVVEENEKEHFHIVLGYEKVFDKSTILNMLTVGLGVSSECISIDKCGSIKSQVRYLIHQDQPEKYQFESSEITTNNIDRTTEYLHDYLEPSTTMIAKWLENGASRVELFNLIGLKNYQAFTSVINSLTSTYTIEQKLSQAERLISSLRAENDYLRCLLARKGIDPTNLLENNELNENQANLSDLDPFKQEQGKRSLAFFMIQGT